MKKLMIHASNVSAMGPTQVVGSMLKAFQNVVDDAFDKVEVVLSERSNLRDYSFTDSRFVKHIIKRRLPNSVSRLVECLSPMTISSDVDAVIVLGDIPLRTHKPQIVFVHQNHLANPSVAPNSNKDLRYKILRATFRHNCSYAKGFVVQTPYMRDLMEKSYPSIIGRVMTMLQPVPNWFNAAVVRSRRRKRSVGDPLKLFYPAANYPHKNFEIIDKASGEEPWIRNVKRVALTLRREERPDLTSPFIEWKGRLGPTECMESYADTDALFFPSCSESYGFPLIEAMLAGLPIIAADLPYARSLCGDQAMYFQHDSAHSAAEAVSTLREKLDAGWQPDWSTRLAGLPSSWDSVCRLFMQML